MAKAMASKASPSEAIVDDDPLKMKKRELNELRSRWRFVDEEAKRRNEERKDLKTRIDDLKAQIDDLAAEAPAGSAE